RARPGAHAVVRARPRSRGAVGRAPRTCRRRLMPMQRNHGEEAGPLEPLRWRNLPLDGRVLIEASAGTGKTWNIGLVYLRLLVERGLGVERILVTTFTEAAAQELRERLRRRIVEVEHWLLQPEALEAAAAQ